MAEETEETDMKKKLKNPTRQNTFTYINKLKREEGEGVAVTFDL